MIYARMDKPKNEYGKGVQTAVSFSGGYLAGILCAIVSHPADVMVSKLNADRKPGESFGGATGRIYKNIGFSGLWNGLPVRIVMIGTLTGLQWMIYGMSPELCVAFMMLVLIMLQITSRSSWVYLPLAERHHQPKTRVFKERQRRL